MSKALLKSSSAPARIGRASQSAVAEMTDSPFRPHHCPAGGAGQQDSKALCHERTRTEATEMGRLSYGVFLLTPTAFQAHNRSTRSSGKPAGAASVVWHQRACSSSRREGACRAKVFNSEAVQPSRPGDPDKERTAARNASREGREGASHGAGGGPAPEAKARHASTRGGSEAGAGAGHQTARQEQAISSAVKAGGTERGRRTCFAGSQTSRDQEAKAARQVRERC